MTTEISSNFETDLNGIIIEYLDYSNLKDTKSAFVEELEKQGKSISKSENSYSFIESNEIQNRFFDAFNRGNKDEFFDLWNTKLTSKLRNEDSVCQKLEFYCQIYFAIFAIKNNFQDKDAESLAMQGFREYLETKGNKVSTNPEFVQFYALPYVSNPKEHPSFCQLFQDSWIPGIEIRLKRFFQLVFGQQSEPKLISIYKRSDDERDDLSLKKLQTEVVESNRRASQLMKKLNQVQLDYHSLLGVTAELVDLLEGSFQGKAVSPAHLQSICQNLFVTQQHRLKSNGIPMSGSIDFSRPGTASMMLRQSIQLTNSSITNNQKLIYEPTVLNKPVKMKPLNFTKLKFDLEHGNLRLKLLLFQAFRWRLTKTDVETRDKFISAITQNDLLGVEPGDYHDTIFQMLNTSGGSVQLQQYLARFINTIATLCRGRSYLVKTSGVCEILFLHILGLTHEESVFRENLIGALQKLSLRRHIQTYMISNGMIEWLMSLLEENSSLTDYTLDYSVALLMNLCLRTSGKKRCVEHKTQIIRVLIKMLDSFNKEITSYVNGALYSILIMPEIREEAIQVNLEATLRKHMSPEHPDMNRQLEYIINQLKSTDEPKFAESDDEEEDDDEEDPEVLESELDKDEIVVAHPNELSGEELLNTNYTLQSAHHKTNQESESENPTLVRPVTPGTFLGRRSTLNNNLDSDRPRTRSGHSNQASLSPDNQNVSLPKSSEAVKQNPNYEKAFSSRPKIPRTPDQENIKRASISSLTGPIQSTGRMPTPSSANGSRKGRASMSTVK